MLRGKLLYSSRTTGDPETKLVCWIGPPLTAQRLPTAIGSKQSRSALGSATSTILKKRRKHCPEAKGHPYPGPYTSAQSAAAYPGSQSVTILGINVGERDRTVGISRELQIRLPFCSTRSATPPLRAYAVDRYRTPVVIDRSGVVRDYRVGSSSASQ